MDKKLTCGQTVIPQVDNSNLACEEYISESCIIVKDASPIIGTQNNQSLREVLLKVFDKLETQSRIIRQLKADMVVLTNKVNNL